MAFLNLDIKWNGPLSGPRFYFGVKITKSHIQCEKLAGRKVAKSISQKVISVHKVMSYNYSVYTAKTRHIHFTEILLVKVTVLMARQMF